MSLLLLSWMICASADPGTAPVEGIRYWASPAQPVEAHLAALKASGFPVPARRVEVSTVTELIAAVQSDTVVLLKPGRYVFADSNLLGDEGEGEGPAPVHPDWSSLSPHYDKGAFHDVKNVVIASAGPGPAVLIQPDTYAAALLLEKVEHVALYNLALGHDPEQGWCRGDVVRAIESTDVRIAGSTLYGSGAQGVSAVSVDGLSVKDSVITDCTEGFGNLSHVRGAVFDHVRIVGNTASLLRGFAIYRSEVTLRATEIRDNHALKLTGDDSYDLLFAVDGDYDMGKWHVDDPKPVDPARKATSLTLDGVTLDGKPLSWPVPSE